MAHWLLPLVRCVCVCVVSGLFCLRDPLVGLQINTVALVTKGSVVSMKDWMDVVKEFSINTVALPTCKELPTPEWNTAPFRTAPRYLPAGFGNRNAISITCISIDVHDNCSTGPIPDRHDVGVG